jgi:hypothetical protein
MVSLHQPRRESPGLVNVRAQSPMGQSAESLVCRSIGPDAPVDLLVAAGYRVSRTPPTRCKLAVRVAGRGSLGRVFSSTVTGSGFPLVSGDH